MRRIESISVHDWVERYEVNMKGRPAMGGDELRGGALEYIRSKVFGHDQGMGYRRLVEAAGPKAMEVFGLFHKLLELQADSRREYRDKIRVRRDGEVASAKDVAFVLSIPEEVVVRGVEILAEIRWVGVEYSGEAAPDADVP